MKRLHFIFAALSFAAVSATITSCIGSGDETIVLESGNSSGIPSDASAGQNPQIGSSTTNIPNVQYTVEADGNDAIVRIDMTGIQDPTSYDWLRLVGTGQNGQNVWVSVDGNPKGILVYNNADNDDNAQSFVTDLVFLVDNSGSMSQEADAIARDLVDWSRKLSSSNLDIRFGCVGFGEGHLTGAINLTDANSLSTYLNRNTGTGRTVGFAGPDATSLSSAVTSFYATGGGECGAAALRYANANFDFRVGANRVYVNFTDEPNQPYNKAALSVEYFSSQSNWNTTQGTVHTVYSADTTFIESRYVREKPWRISQYTGGTTLVASSSFTGVTLESLPVTGAMTNSYIIRFTNVSEYMDGNPHEVKVTVLSVDGNTRAERVFYMIFGTAG